MPTTSKLPDAGRRCVGTTAVAAFAVAVALLASGVTATEASVSTTRQHVIQPTTAQLARLGRYERYIEYFAGLAYGPQQSRVSADYIRALILTESSAQRYAVSHKGARGLTQIMPDTGRMAARELAASGIDFRYVDERKLAAYHPDVLFDPAVNILIACYLGALYHTDYHGRIDLAAAAWNAGPQAVARYGNRMPPFRETHGMIHRLVGYLTYFSRQKGALRPSLRWSDFSGRRWDTSEWHEPGWDSKKVDWRMPF